MKNIQGEGTVIAKALKGQYALYVQGRAMRPEYGQRKMSKAKNYMGWIGAKLCGVTGH
jgi:hypothetical protein